MNIDLYYDMGHTILEAVLDAYDNAAPPLVPPERQYVTFGNVAADCDQLVVEYGGATPLEADNFLPCIPITDHIYRIWVMRCNSAWEDDNIPSADTLDTSAQIVLRDAYVLAGLFPAELKAASLCSKLQIVSLESFGPEGGLGGVILTITFKSI